MPIINEFPKLSIKSKEKDNESKFVFINKLIINEYIIVLTMLKTLEINIIRFYKNKNNTKLICSPIYIPWNDLYIILQLGHDPLINIIKNSL